MYVCMYVCMYICMYVCMYVMLELCNTIASTQYRNIIVSIDNQSLDVTCIKTLGRELCSQGK